MILICLLILLQYWYASEGLAVSLPGDLMSSYADIFFESSIQNISAAQLFGCVSHGILVDEFHNFCASQTPSLCDNISLRIHMDEFHNFCASQTPSLCDNISFPLDTCRDNHDDIEFSVASVVYELHIKLVSFLRLLPCYLYLSLQSDITKLLIILYRNIYVHTVFVFCVPQEDPHSIIYLLFLSMKRSSFLRHNFLACVANFAARHLILQSDVHRRLCSARSRLDQLKLIYSLRDSLPNHFSLPWLFILMQIVSMVTVSTSRYRAYLPSRHITTSTQFTPCSPFFSVHTNAQLEYHSHEHVLTYGGGRQHEFSILEVEPYITASADHNFDRECTFKFVDYVDTLGQERYQIAQHFIHATIPLSCLIPYVPVRVALKIARLHHLQIGSHVPKSEICRIFENHDHISCYETCKPYVTVFTITDSTAVRRRKSESEKKKVDVTDSVSYATDSIPCTTFPPAPLSNDLSLKIINDFSAESLPSAIEEAGCAVCGRLVPVSQLTRLKAVKNFLHVLQAAGVTRVERSNQNQPIREFKGPVLDYGCNRICNGCREQVRKGKVPHYALANGLWLGNVPEVLSCLTYIERLLVARVRVNSCFVRVASSGLRKMASHVIAFETPVPKLYHSLPPPLEDLDDVLAILFTGPCKPTEEEFKCTPLLIRRKNVADALEWLKLNHSDYTDLDISYDELKRYPENAPPVSIHYQHSLTNKVEEGTSVFDDAPDDGVEDGVCPFVVHGLTGDQLTTKTTSTLKGIALRHWNNHGGALAISHDASPQSIYNNPKLYPQIFPWLFPYGFGGVGSTKISDKLHKRYLLMYHDKRFQQDVCFPFVAFSHHQENRPVTLGHG